MFEELLIRGCAPTLAGLKTGNMICVPVTSRKACIAEIRRLNRQLRPKGLCLLPLRYRGDRVLLYLFRPNSLQRDLQSTEAGTLLRERGYADTRWEHCVLELVRRLNDEEEFPHEVGLFLSYPAEDVRGFMEEQACNFKCCGCWKVYGDEEKARKRFAQYRACTRCFLRQWQQGRTVSQLAVSAS